MEVRKGLLYSKEHEWVQEVSDSLVRIALPHMQRSAWRHRLHRTA